MENYEAERSFFDKCLSEIKSDLSLFLRSLSSEKLQKDSLDSFQGLNNIQSQLSTLESKVSSLITPDPSSSNSFDGLSSISQELAELKASLDSLSASTTDLCNTLSGYNKDSKEFLSIYTIKYKDKKWYIEVNGPAGCQENFRNVDIYEVESNKIVCQFKLIEPYARVKKTTTWPLKTLNHLVAKIGNRIVSDLVLIPLLRISELEYNEPNFILKITSLSHIEQKDIKLVDNKGNELLLIERIEAFAKDLQFGLDLSLEGKFSLFLMIGDKIVSEAYETEIAVPEYNFEDEIVALTESQKLMAKYIYDYHSHEFTPENIIRAVTLLDGQEYDRIHEHLKSMR